MIRWYHTLYLDNTVSMKVDKVKKSIEKNKKTIGIYCIALALNEQNLFDIMNVNELLFTYYRSKDIYIVGLAQGRESAKRLVARIIEDVYRETNDFKAREYFLADSR